jgi:aryl-alcohol dehydrogenase
METKAAVIFEKSGKFSIETLALSEPKNDEVLVRVVAAGICHTDIAGREQYLPIPPERAFPTVFGHEGAGIVEAVGANVTKVKPGDHVALSWDYCGACPTCMAGHQPYCDDVFLHNFNGARPDGSATLHKGEEVIHGSFFCQSSFAELALANERNVVKVRNDVPIEIAGPLGCGIRTGAGAVMISLRPEPGASIAIFGVGPVGISAILAATVCGCTTIIAVDVVPDRLAKAKEFGATHTVNANETDPVEAIREITGGGAAYSLECVGNPQVLRQAVDCLPRLGVCGCLGVVPPGTEVALDMEQLMNGRTVRGILAGDSNSDLFIPKLLDLYSQGRFPFDRMITYYPFEDINKAVDDMLQGKVIKPVLKMK